MKLFDPNKKDAKRLVEKFLKRERGSLSSHSFINLFIWQDFFKFYYEIIDNQLCIFAKDEVGTFLYLPPLGSGVSKDAIISSFQIMNSFNKNTEVSRIENIEEADLINYKGLGYKTYLKSKDYLHSTKDLINLTGNRFKSKRSSYNYFIRNYSYEFFDYENKYRDECLRLFKLWQGLRLNKHEDQIYNAMLKQSQVSFKRMLLNADFLSVIGCVVKVDGKIKASSFGYKLDKETFCINFEISDLKIKGISQFIFREFCKRMKKFKYVNVMDDSGLSNLERVKLSYSPLRLIPSYCAKI